MTQEILDKLTALEAKIDKLSNVAGFKVAWEDKMTESNIQIQGGPTTVKRTGVVLGTAMFPTSPTDIVIMFVVKRDGDDHIVSVGPGNCKFIK